MKWPGMHKWTNSGGIVIPKHLIKEELDRQHRQDWEDADRYERQKQKALKYIPVRAPEVEQLAWERLVREVARVFHDDLARDPDVRTAAQQACFYAQQQQKQDLEVVPEPAMMAADQDERGDVRGVDDSDETCANLEQQLKDELDS